MTQNSKRIAVILSVLILVIGFAAVTTTLVLNGGLLISESDDFKIIFTEAILDGKKDNSLISSDKKTITFESQELLDLNDKTTLEYMVANTSRNYDANVSVNCSISSDASEYVYIRNNPSEMIVEAGTSKKGTIEVELIKVLTESKEVSLTCELVSTPIERDSLGDEYAEPDFSKVGMLKKRYVNDNLNSVDFWEYGDMITKIIFEDTLSPHETSENLIFDVSVNQDGSVMSYLVHNNEDNAKYILYIQADGAVKANEDSSNLFSNFSSMVEIQGLEYFDTGNVVNMRELFSGCSSLTNLNLSNFDTSSATNMIQMFSGCGSLTSLDLSNFDTGNVVDMSELFSNCRSLASLDLSNFDTSNVTDMSGMFSNCNSLANLDLSNFDTKNVIFMNSMFDGCSSLISLDVSNFDTNNVTNMNHMFNYCSSLTSLDLSNFNTGKVTGMSSMFYDCSNLASLDLNSFDTNKVTDMSYMFSGCSNLASLDLNSFDTNKVTDMSYMFWRCKSLISLDLSNFDTSNVTNMNHMFYDCSNLTNLNLSNFDISNVTSASQMFRGIPNNAKVYVKDMVSQEWVLNTYDRPSAWTTENVIVKS